MPAAPRDDLPGAVFLPTTKVARLIGVGHSKVLGWIHSGRLAAINTSSGSQRPRFKVRETDLEIFLATLAVNAAPSAPRRKRAPSQNVIEFLK